MLGKRERVRFRWGLFLIGLVMFVASLILMIMAGNVDNPPPFIEGPWVLLSVPFILGLAAMVLAVYEYRERKGMVTQTGDVVTRIDWRNFLMGLAVFLLGVLLLADFCNSYCLSVTGSISLLTDLGLRLCVMIGGILWFGLIGFKEEKQP